jgi:hypothetical protein
MENLNLSSLVAKLWNMHQQRENLYKQTMALDNLGPLRRLCSRGYMASLLFKKEISWIYDQIKCTLSEGDISRGISNHNVPNLIISSDDQPLVKNMLVEQEDKTIRMYKVLLDNRDITNEAKEILSDHLEQLGNIHYYLKKEVSKSQIKIPVLRQAVA